MKAELTIKKDQMLANLDPATTELISIIQKGEEMSLGIYEKNLTLGKAIEGTSLKKLEKTIGEKNLTLIIVFIITRLASHFNVGKKFTADQALMLALDIIERFAYETLEDMFLMFKMVRTGLIGDGKDFKLDSQTVFHKWIPQYLELKAVKREDMHNRQKDETTALPKWEMKDVEKFVVSKEPVTKKTEKNTLGQRSKKHFAVPEGMSPIKTRQDYLKGLEYEASRVPFENLKTALIFFTEKNEQDAIEVINNEITKRNF